LASDRRDGPNLSALLLRARLALFWEGAWPWAATAISVATVFLAVSWFGLWDALPPLGRMSGVALFALAFLAALSPIVRAALPSRQAALARLDRESGIAHRPATSLDDRLSATSDDPLTRALWKAHAEKLAADARRLKAGAPAPKLAARDPYALRFLLGLVAVAAFAYAGADRGDRLRAAFNWANPAPETAPARIDAWVAPPAYTGRPPIFLTARAGADAQSAAPDAAAETVRAPVGSMVVVRGSGGAVAVTAEGGVQPVEAENRPPEGLTERRFKLTGDAGLKIAASGSPERVWRFAAIPDAPPSITIDGALKQNARGTATVAYEVKDDYGVVSAEARFVLKPDPAAAPNRTTGDRGDAPPAKPHPLYEAPKVALGLPRAKAREGRGQTALDTMEHPFAGAEATMTLYARDEAGQEGASASLNVRLPARSFTNPLARALVEQRRVLASDADSKPHVLQALRALALYPEQFTPQAGVYLGLTTAYRRLEIAVSDDELRGAADYIWEVALRIEDGDLPDAERDLKAAEQALRKALEEGAPEQEVAKLTQDLRQALEKFMREMASQAQKQPQQQAQPGQKGPQAVTPKDLRDMVDRMEQLSKQGSKEAAKQALADLKNMLDNLQNAQRQQADPNAQAQAEQMEKLQDMIREQQKLRDKTFQQYRQNDRAERNQRQQGRQKQGDQGEQAMRDLEKQQQQLRDKLDQMMKEMGQGQQQGEQQPGQQQGEGQQKGQQPGKQGQGQQGEGQQPGQNELGQAGKSMGDAKGALGQGQTGEALDQQQKALESMRKGAQAMSESQGQGQPGQRGQQGEQGAENGEEGRDDDPLGRPTRRRESDGNTTKVPGQIEAERARKVLDELRRRLGESERSRGELDYLERLLAP
jgi:uncharacterized protein (TIGR02302 family)